MTLTRKLVLRFGAIMGILLIIGIILVAFLTYQSRALEGVLRDNYDSLRYCARMSDAVEQIHDSAQSLDAHLAPRPEDVAESRKTFEFNARSQIGNSFLPGERELSMKTLAAGQRCFAQYDTLASMPVADRPAFLQNNFLPSYKECRDSIQQISQMNLVTLAAVNAEIRSALLHIRNTVIALVILGGVLSAILVILTARDLTRPIAQLTRSVRQVETGDLDAVVQTGQKDEIGVLAEAFNAMAAHLREFRRLDHERLLRTEQTTQTAIDSLPDAVAVIDSAGNIEIANKTAQVHFALAPGANLRNVRPDWAKPFLDDVLASGKPMVPDGYRSAIQLFDESGERFLLPRAVPMFAAGGEIIGVTLILVEVTHLRRADEFKSGLIATVSHELKTPLTSIRMAVRMLLDKRIGTLNPQQQRLLDAAKIDSERLVRTLDDMLAIGRVEAGLARMEVSEIPVRELLDRSLAPVESVLAEKHISLDIQIPPGNLTVYADLTLLACALTNILSNAAKFSPGGSRISIVVSPKPDIDQISVAITDAGPGIAEEYQERIFDKFFRIPVASGPTGAGLGLSIAREIMLLQNGTISLRSTVGQGSTFIIQIPRSSS